jgi:hypothetical protein
MKQLSSNQFLPLVNKTFLHSSNEVQVATLIDVVRSNAIVAFVAGQTAHLTQGNWVKTDVNPFANAQVGCIVMQNDVSDSAGYFIDAAFNFQVPIILLPKSGYTALYEAFIAMCANHYYTTFPLTRAGSESATAIYKTVARTIKGVGASLAAKQYPFPVNNAGLAKKDFSFRPFSRPPKR